MTKYNWQQRIDEELGAKKWNDNLSAAIQRQAMVQDNHRRKAPVFIPFISVAMLTIVVFLTLSFWPQLFQQSEQASPEHYKFQQVYYSKLPANSYQFGAQENLYTIGMAKTNEPELLRQLSIAYQEKQEIEEPRTDNSQIMSVILVDDVGIKYHYNLYRTFTDELLFEEANSYQFYKYSGPETSTIFELLTRQLNLKAFIVLAVVIILIELAIIPPVIRKYYGVKKRKQTFDHIGLNRLVFWLPLPYLLYINFKLVMKPVTLTWWEVIVPFILYQVIILMLMKQQKEPHPYIVERMLSFCGALILLIGVMILL